MEIYYVITTTALLGFGLGFLVSRLTYKEQLSVVTYPYKEETGNDGFISDHRKVEIGYKYQLFIKGMPCFTAHKMPVETLERKQISPEKIEAATNAALTLIDQLVKLHPAIKSSGTVNGIGNGSTIKNGQKTKLTG